MRDQRLRKGSSREVNISQMLFMWKIPSILPILRIHVRYLGEIDKVSWEYWCMDEVGLVQAVGSIVDADILVVL